MTALRRRTWTAILLALVGAAVGLLLIMTIGPGLQTRPASSRETVFAAAPEPVGSGGADGFAAPEDQAQAGAGVGAPQAPIQQRLILRNASLRIVVDDAGLTLNRISTLAAELGGWVVSSTSSQVRTSAGQEVLRGAITVRVPAERLDEALALIKAGAGTVESESVTGQDVTQQYVDLTSRVANLEAAEAQLQTIMDGATRTQDVMEVYNQLVSVRGEIEVLRGQIQYFEEAAAFSSITVEIVPTAIEAPIQIAGWSPGRTVERALATLVTVLQFAADVAISVVVVVLPLALIVGVPVWFIRRRWRARKAAQQGA